MPMYYESLPSLSQLRQKSNMSTRMSSLLENLDETIDDLIISGNGNDMETNRHYIMTSLALLFLGHGLADEAYDLIIPLSWSEDTYFGGPTLVSRADETTVPANHQFFDSSTFHTHPKPIYQEHPLYPPRPTSPPESPQV